MFEIVNDVIHLAVQPKMMKYYLIFHLIFIFHVSTDVHLHDFIKIIQLVMGLLTILLAVMALSIANYALIYPLLFDSCARFLFFVFGMGLWVMKEIQQSPETHSELYYNPPSAQVTLRKHSWKIMHFIQTAIVILFYEILFITSLLFIKTNNSNASKNDYDPPPLYDDIDSEMDRQPPPTYSTVCPSQV